MSDGLLTLNVAWAKKYQEDITTLRAEVEMQAELIERLKMEARIHHDEAAGANATIAEIYQVVTGSKGEPGNWNGAVPVRALMARAEKLEAALKLAQPYVFACCHDDDEAAHDFGVIEVALASLTEGE